VAGFPLLPHNTNLRTGISEGTSTVGVTAILYRGISNLFREGGSKKDRNQQLQITVMFYLTLDVANVFMCLLVDPLVRLILLGSLL